MSREQKPSQLSHEHDALARSEDRVFATILERRLSRRGLLRNGALAGAVAAVPVGTCSDRGPTLLELADERLAAVQRRERRLGFAPVAKGLQDHVVVPEGYLAFVLTAVGDPIDTSTSAYANDGSDRDFARRVGDHGDALAYFPLPKYSRSSRDGLLVQNHEAVTDLYIHAAGPTHDPYVDKAATQPRPLAEVIKEQEAHGISLLRVTKRSRSGKWAVDRSNKGNSRWHVNTPMVLAGPAAGAAQMITKLSPAGDRCFGTLNNCGNGVTPWGTYLSGEENWAFYFTRGDDAAADPSRDERFARQGITANNVDPTMSVAPWNYRGWDRAEGGGDLQKRFDCTLRGATAADDFRNEPNHFGYVVELDPYEPGQPAKKRTALGRMAHEGAWFGPVVAGQPLVIYMGDDSRNEYVYKFVSTASWNPADATRGMAAGDEYLDHGTLYAARFDEDGRGEWLPLDEDNPALSSFEDLADIVINCRAAADAAEATKMDRPEWGAVNPRNGEFYVTLTNNSTRGTSGPQVDAANPRSYEDAKGQTIQKGNVNGHILRLREDEGDPAATTFTWDVYLFGAQSDADATRVNLSSLTADNDFSSPDGVWFDARGVLWIQTDDGAYTDVTNCMMLAAVPGEVGDGGEITVGSQKTQMGRSASSDVLRRFLVGVPGCEITGVDMTPDHKTMFVNIQHPGETGTLTEFQSNWPSMTTDDAAAAGLPGTRPRTATIVITRADGGTIGM
jgi:hypothetical protein